MREKILLIDDEDAIRLIGKRALESAGYRVTLAESAEDGLERFSADDFDLVITDLLLSGTGGLETVEKIRADKPDIPVMVISGTDLNSDEFLEVRRKTGIDAALAKPFELTALLQSVRTCLG